MSAITSPQPPVTIPSSNLNNGSVTSVGVAVSPEFTVTGTPVTTSGVIVIGKANEPSKTVWAGPVAGPNAQPTFRALVFSDLPPETGTVKSVDMSVPVEFDIAGNPITDTGTLVVTKKVQSANDIYAGPVVGPDAQPTFRPMDWDDLPPGVGTVTSVDMTVPTEFDLTGNPITTNGTLAIAKKDQQANDIYAGPVTGPDAQPTFRPMDWDDLPAGVGTVTSIDMSVPTEFDLTGNPITTNGTLAIAKKVQSANKLYAGPSTGPDAQPTFRAMVTADLPPGVGTVTSVDLSVPGEFAVSGNPITTNGTLTVTKTTQQANKLYAGPNTGPDAQPAFRSLVTADLPAGTGTVTSVGLTGPAEFTYGATVTGSGNLTFTKASQTQNQVWASPNGASGAPTFRALVATDLPPATGTVTSVGLSMPSEFAVANSPVVGSGTLAVTAQPQAPNTVWAGPLTGPNAAPQFRALDPADISTLISWDQVLTAGNTSGFNNPTINGGQRIQYSGSILVGGNGNAPVVSGAGANQLAIGGGATVTRANQVVIGGNAVAGSSADDCTMIGVNTQTASTAASSVVMGANAQVQANAGTAVGHTAIVNATHTRSAAFGIGASTTAANQLRFGTATENGSFPGNLQVDQYIRSLQQKACGGGITPGVSALQTIAVGATNTLDIKDVLFDPLSMISTVTDRISLTDTQQCWGVSCLVRGDFGGLNPGANNYVIQLIWFDGATDRIIGELQPATVANVNSWGTTLGTGARTNASAGQYLYCRITNNTLVAMNLTHFRFSVTRIA